MLCCISMDGNIKEMSEEFISGLCIDRVTDCVFSKEFLWNCDASGTFPFLCLIQSPEIDGETPCNKVFFFKAFVFEENDFVFVLIR